MQTHKETIDYVMRFGGRCRDCADEDGICPTNGTPCEPAPKRAVIEHTLKALEYGMSHGFIQSPFTRPSAPVERLETIGYVHRGTAGLLMEGAVSKAVIVPKPGGDFKHPVVFAEQAEAIIAAERARYHALEEIAAGLVERTDKAEADNAALTARVKELEEKNKSLTEEWYRGLRVQKKISDRADATELRLTTALTQLRSECQSPIDMYERNGPEYTSPHGSEYESTAHVMMKFAELVTSIDAALEDRP